MLDERILQQELSEELSTVGDVLRWLASNFNRSELFFGHGTENAWDEAVALLTYYLELMEEELSLSINSKITKAERSKLWAPIRERILERKPLAYITNHASFAELDFYVDERVLIPRSPFAELILDNFEPWSAGRTFTNALDLCTGSACIACAIAYYMPEVQVDATDISLEALEVAKKNVIDLGLVSSIKLKRADLFEGLPPKQYDLIVANPPYVSAESYAKLPKEYSFEPRLGLESEENGLIHTINILQNAAQYLTPDGLLFIEVGEAWDELQKKFPDINFEWVELENGGEGILVLTKQALTENTWRIA